MTGRGAGDGPVTWEGAYDHTRTYLPRQIVTLDGMPYMSTAKQVGVDPPAATWLTFGGPVLFVSNAAAGPPTDGSLFWYVLDETC